MTGSSLTGKRILEAVAPYLKKISLELGGHAPAIICNDADIENAASVVAYKGFRNNGQSCSAVNRVYVHKSIHREFVDRLKVLAEKLTMGDGVNEPDVDLGPMCTSDVLAKVKQHVADAIAKGATLIAGGEAPIGDEFSKGHYYLPTILDNVPDDALMMNEETFGAVVPVQSFDTLEEAIIKSNRSRYGLVSYLFTKDFKTTVTVSEALESGTVAVNCGAVNSNYAPYAGWKDSGYGLELSRKAVFEYLQTKHIKIDMI
jgi:acyl-CoA reductase-like NAD-dependent aldehyde dehydrogenase